MIKSEFLQKCKEAHIRIPFEMIFDLYKIDDDIPNELIKIMFEPPQKKEFIIYGNEKMINAVEEAIAQDVKKLLKDE